MLVSNNPFFFISLTEDFSKLRGNTSSQITPIFNNAKITIGIIPASEIDLFKKNIREYSPRIISYFDYYYLMLPLTKKLTTKLYEEFFDYISPDYEHLIDLNRNQENIYNLLKIVQGYTYSKTKLVILDYGCGTGISHSFAKNYNYEIIGFDICPNMRQNASSKGMIVWGEKDLIQQPKSSIDAVISSYVFHFLIDDSYFKLLYKLLKPNGIIVANFHKNKNRNFIDQSLNKIGFEIIQSTILKNKEYHGTYVVYRKS